MPKVSNIYQDKNSGLWYFVANLGYDKNGKRVRKWGRGYKTQKEAKMAYDKFMNDYGETSVKMNSTMSYKEFYTTYYEQHYKRSVSVQTYENRKSSMDMHFSYFFNVKLKDINAPMLSKWQSELSKKYANSYIRSIYGSFQMSLDYAVKLGLLQTNVAKQIGNVKKTKYVVEFWTKDEFEKVVTTFNKKDYYEHFSFMLIWFLFMTGLRFGEAQALLWNKDIDFNNKTVTVNKTLLYKNAKDFKNGDTKTYNSKRTIALDDNTVAYLKEWKAIQEKNIKSDFVFSYNGLPFPKSTSARIIERHAKLANVHRIRTHALRHSHASLLISLGQSALVVRDRLGHADIKTTLGTYGHLYPNTNLAVAQKLTNLITVKTDESLTKKVTSNQYVKR